jgi:predicted ribosomally synthesized peptide with SipW-like signal peptide
MIGRKLGALFLVAIMSLVGIGVSYASWSQSVDINATVTTGNFDFQITGINVDNNNGATITAAPYDGHLWYVTVSGTYPGWIGYITVTHKNTGTVYLKYNTFQVLSLAGDLALQQGYTLKFYPGAYPTPGTANIWGTLYNLQTLQYYDSWIGPYQIKLAPGDTHASCVSLELDSGITDHYGSAVTFVFEMTAIQTTP